MPDAAVAPRPRGGRSSRRTDRCRSAASSARGARLPQRREAAPRGRPRRARDRRAGSRRAARSRGRGGSRGGRATPHTSKRANASVVASRTVPAGSSPRGSRARAPLRRPPSLGERAHPLGRRRRPQPIACAREQRRARAALDRGEPATHRRRVDAEPRARFLERARAEHRQQHANVVPLHQCGGGGGGGGGGGVFSFGGGFTPCAATTG